MIQWCLCGQVLHGGTGAHRAMHVRRGNWEPSAKKRAAAPPGTAYGFILREEYLETFPDRDERGMRKSR